MKPRILIIDDDVNGRFSLAELLRAEGYEVDEAGHGQEGLRIFQEGHSDAVITDLYMPQVNGIQTLRELRSRKPGLTVILLTGDSHIAASDVLKVAGVTPSALLHKPADAADILAVLAAAPLPAGAAVPLNPPQLPASLALRQTL